MKKNFNLNLKFSELKEILEEKFNAYNCLDFISTDPISIPHQFTKKEDIEISGFLAAIISWGQRPIIIRNAIKLIGLMDNSPFDFVMNHTDSDLKPFEKFTHRTFNGKDCCYFIQSLKNIYLNHDGLENIFKKSTIYEGIINLNKAFFELPYEIRTKKHIANPEKGASAKRINMFLRWMIRKDSRGVDFGIWNSIKPSQLYCPLDIHSGNAARQLGILKRKQNDWKAVEELTGGLKKFDYNDPVKYDFALFGMGIFEKINSF